ncbi:OmpP1/FadL family transporter [Polymorphum gilvum]|uniref:Outer membrane protein transport protein (OMPP1/FadL/TodX) n=1 Tax=Polymorphum gilvum (strain LMG 25793 / CGMCC 1.9160 / SL003B-26A1) TaxID=991905 RepID=F2J3A4_POLGS|nr:OmpP1/FadL family transporter [Polymorphum gilvum]ADZ69911.1 Outer membrane protein transport protein (OMPP1/FadL/TodX) [Polymorphum gilvum SL003B-26A1]
MTSSTAASGEMASDAFIPASYTAYKFSDSLFFGLAVNAPYGLATKPDIDWAAKWYGRSSEVFSINVNPMVGYKINDMISVGVGLQVQYFQVRLKSAYPLSPTASTAEVKGDDIGFGFNAGVTFKPIEGTEIGLGFRSAVSHELNGQYILPSGFLPGPIAFGATSTDIKAKLMTPEMVTLSISQRVSEAFRVAGTVEWTNWSRLGTIHTRPTGATALPVSVLGTPDLKFNYDDGWFFALGGEYDWNDKLTLRAGVAYELSPIDLDIRSTRLPDNDRLWLSAGLSYTVRDNLSFDLGYTHIIPKSTKVRIVPGHQDYNASIGTYVSNVSSQVDIFTASLRYRWGGSHRSAE